MAIADADVDGRGLGLRAGIGAVEGATVGGRTVGVIVLDNAHDAQRLRQGHDAREDHTSLIHWRSLRYKSPRDPRQHRDGGRPRFQEDSTPFFVDGVCLRLVTTNA